MSLERLMELPQHSLPQAEKESLLLDALNSLTAHHLANCAEYRKLAGVFFGSGGPAPAIGEVPYVPVGLFKSHELLSIPRSGIFKVLTSSGTTGQEVSQIFLDRQTSQLQVRALSLVMRNILGTERLPMLLVESSALLKDRRRFSARTAGVLGMINFGRNHFYCLNEEMELDEAGLRGFLERFGGKPFLIFGFTFMAWKYLFERLRGRGADLSNGLLIHSGGWKKMQEIAVDNDTFKRRWSEETGLRRIYNFYGMVEQVGSVFTEGGDGFLYAPNFADVIVRDPVTWEALPPGEPGLIQVLSALPHSYPGHSILTEDRGVIHGIDDSRCGRLGKRFSVLGRVAKAELRGCSDVHAAAGTAV